MIDLQLAFQEYDEHSFSSRGANVSRFFNLLTGIWPFRPDDEVDEFWRLDDHFCGETWCFFELCFDHPYSRVLNTQVRRFEASLKSDLEEYRARDFQGIDGPSKIKESMKENDLISLLPGMVPGWALKSRKWGRDAAKSRHEFPRD